MAAGVTVMDAAVAPPDHEKTPPGKEGMAVSVADCPVQIVIGAMTMEGTGFTVTDADAEAVHTLHE